MSATGDVFTSSNQRAIYSLVAQARTAYQHNKDSHNKVVENNETTINRLYRNSQDDINKMCDMGYIRKVAAHLYILL